MNAAHIYNAYIKAVAADRNICNFDSFTAGYLALLNELEHVPLGEIPIYRLPEGVSK